jgi:hypothetical protein
MIMRERMTTWRRPRTASVTGRSEEVIRTLTHLVLAGDDHAPTPVLELGPVDVLGEPFVDEHSVSGISVLSRCE